MAAKNVIIVGHMYEGKSNKGKQVTIYGVAGESDKEIGGGPVIPPPPDPFPDPPPDGVVIKPAPDEGGWGYIGPEPGWYFVPPAGSVSPK